MNPNLPEAPPRIAKLPLDKRGYPVPWFVEWFNGEPDFRVISDAKRRRAFSVDLCWICGERMGVHQVFAVGPMCLINLTTAEPALHRDCAEYAVKACPFLTQPRRRRNDAEALPEGAHVDGVMIERNPGVTALVEAKGARRFSDRNGGWLIRLVQPTRVDWWAHGRQATLEEVRASIDSGAPLLMGPARAEGEEAVHELKRLTAEAAKWLPVA
jgi:hypothetical protein